MILQNLKNNFGIGFTPKEVEEMFNEFDLDKDGKLYLEDFINLLLPADYMMEEKVDHPTKVHINT